MEPARAHRGIYPQNKKIARLDNIQIACMLAHMHTHDSASTRTRDTKTERRRKEERHTDRERKIKKEENRAKGGSVRTFAHKILPHVKKALTHHRFRWQRSRRCQQTT